MYSINYAAALFHSYGAKTLRTKAFSIMTLINDTGSNDSGHNKNHITGTQHDYTLLRMALSTMKLSIPTQYKDNYAECHYAECHSAECHYAECHYAECHYAECHYAECHYAECHYAECHYAECHYAECHYAKSRGAIPDIPKSPFFVFASILGITYKLFMTVTYGCRKIMQLCQLHA
jgi:hypothetical protein